MKEPSPFSLELDAQLESVPRARHELARWMNWSGVPAQIRDEMSLVVTELVTNAIEASPGSSAKVSVWSCLSPDDVILRVIDEGPGFDLPVGNLTVPQPATDRGRGLPIVRALMDHIAVRRDDGRTEVEVSRSLPSPARRRVAFR